MLKAYDEKTGKEVKLGDTITDFRGAQRKLCALTRARTPGKSGKLFDGERECYDRVYGLMIVEG